MYAQKHTPDRWIETDNISRNIFINFEYEYI